MKVLALELSSARGSLAWLGSDHAVVQVWPNDRKNSGPFFDNLLAVRKQFGQPDAIIVGLGPGSYAGVRIAISTAMGLQAAAKARLLGYPSICALEDEAKEYCVIGDARRKSFFFARVRANNLIEGPNLSAENELQDRLASLDGEIPVFASEQLPQFDRVIVRYPGASLLARLARDSEHVFALPPLEPLYLRDPYVTMPGSAVQSKVVP
jgi:tRNA threonylcarbamoyladenosine biosynthesis protein TsaB